MQFAQRPLSVKRGDRTTTYSDGSQAFLMLARTLRAQASLKTTGLYAGGISVSEHDSDRGDRELRQPFATKHLHERTHAYPRTIDPYTLERED